MKTIAIALILFVVSLYAGMKEQGISDMNVCRWVCVGDSLRVFVGDKPYTPNPPSKFSGSLSDALVVLSPKCPDMSHLPQPICKKNKT